MTFHMSTTTSDTRRDMPRPPSDAVQIALRVPGPWLTEADKIAKFLSRPGFEASRSDALRAALAKGLEVLLSEQARAKRKEEEFDELKARMNRAAAEATRNKKR
jgi:hypothetical protein